MEFVEERSRAVEDEAQRIQAALEKAAAERNDLKKLIEVLMNHPTGVQTSLEGIRKGNAPWIDNLHDATAALHDEEDDNVEVLSKEEVGMHFCAHQVVGPTPRKSTVRSSASSTGSGSVFVSPSSRHYVELQSARSIAKDQSKTMHAVTKRDMKPNPALARRSSQTSKNKLLPKAKSITDGAAAKKQDFEYYRRSSTGPKFHPSIPITRPPNRDDNCRPLSSGPLSSRGAGRLPTRRKSQISVPKKTGLF